MNLTGGVVLGLLYLLPGILFVAGLTRLYTTRAPSPFDGQLSVGLVVAVVASIVLHSCFIGLGHLLFAPLGWPTPSASTAISLLLGDPKNREAHSLTLSVGHYWPWIALYFGSLSVFSFAGGRQANRLFKSNEKASWYDILRGESADFIWMTVDLEVGGEGMLYAGVVLDFRVSESGALERVVLIGAVRRPIRRPSATELKSSPEAYNERGWISIPGEHVVLNTATAKTINVDYWYADKEDASRLEEEEQQKSSALAQEDDSARALLPHWCN